MVIFFIAFSMLLTLKVTGLFSISWSWVFFPLTTLAFYFLLMVTYVVVYSFFFRKN
jgi:hypothetical protein